MTEQAIGFDELQRPAIRTLFWTGRMRGLFAGLGYALTLALFFILSWALQSRAHDYPYLSLLAAGQAVGLSAVRYGIAILPPLPVLILTLNIAPRGVLKRVACLAFPVVLMTLWSYWILGLENPWYTDMAERFLSAVLLAAVCQYNFSVRGATGTLLRTRLQSATLGAELDRARLQLLRSQIEPHFLFNTLANIRALAHIDKGAAVEMLDNLMRYLAAALPKLRQDHSALAEEMQLLEAYLSIFRVRMGARLSYAIDLPPDLAQLRVPTMMLLTLVENALKHGINPVIEGGFIRVSAARSGAMLILKVADSGHGLGGQSHGTGTGLSNVRLRLMMQYGASAHLSLAHAEPRGVVAAISLPMRALS
jgi:two-component sensor histidine kinase